MEALADTASTPHRTSTYLTTGLVVTGLLRVLAFPFARNFYGDPVMRLHALSDWLAHPFFLRSFIGARQFGPLHLYLLAAVELVTHEQVVGPRLLSLIFGTLTAWPLFRLAERRFGPRAALLSTLAFATYGLHIQASTTAVSEGVFLFFLLEALALLDRAGERPGFLLGAGLCMACACAVRYDGWLYAPLSIFWLLRSMREGRVSPRAGFGYLLLVLAVPTFLMWGNWVDMGDPLYLIHYIDQDHLMNAARASAQLGRGWYAVYCLAFWPANLLLEMTPVVFVACVVAMVSTWRARSARDLWLLALIPASYFSLKGALLLAFHPLARFTLPTAVLLMPYAGRGLELMAAGLSRVGRRLFYAAAVLSAVGVPGFITARTLGQSDALADTMRPICPVSNLPPDLSATAIWLRANTANHKVLLETNWLYEELPIGFYADLPSTRLWNLRFGPLPDAFGEPDLLVLPKESDLLKRGEATLAGDDLVAYGRLFRKVVGFGRVVIYGSTVPNG